MKKIIEVNDFVKSYGDVKAVKGISFYVEEGKLFSFLGPNGAGKSTTIDTLCTLMDFDSGNIVIDSYDLRQDAQEIRQSIGVVFQSSVLDDQLTVKENLFTGAEFYSKNKKSIKSMVDEASEVTGLSEFFNRPYGKLSGGQRRRADIANALLHKPKILFLDEPTTGLDPQTRVIIWETIKKLQAESGMTIFLTTHYMEEATESDYIIVIDHGEIAAKGTAAELKSQYSSDMLRVIPNNEEGLREQLTSMKIDYTMMGNEFRIRLAHTVDSFPILDKCRPYVASYQVIQGTMDEAFIGIVGRGIR